MSNRYEERESITGTDSVLEWMRRKDRYAGLTLDQRLTLNAREDRSARVRKENEGSDQYWDEYAPTQGVYGKWSTNADEVERKMSKELGHYFPSTKWHYNEHMSDSRYHRAWARCQVCGRSLVVWGDGDMTGNALEGRCSGKWEYGE